MGLNVRQVLEIGIRPALRVVAQAWSGAASEAAERLLLGVAAHESRGFHFLSQSPTGPARGLWQMEVATHHSLWANFIAGREGLAIALRSLATASSGNVPPTADEMAWNLRYGAAMARAFFLAVRERLPDSEDIPGMAMYWKRYWNTALGKGRPEQFVKAYATFVTPVVGA